MCLIDTLLGVAVIVWKELLGLQQRLGGDTVPQVSAGMALFLMVLMGVVGYLSGWSDGREGK